MKRHLSTVLAAVAATALLPATAGAVGSARPGAAPAAPDPAFSVHCSTVLKGTQQTESWLFTPAPSKDGRTVSAVHRTSYRDCTGSASSTLNENTAVQWKATCAEPFPTTSSETVTYAWDTGASTTVRFDRITRTHSVNGSVVRYRLESKGTVTAGSGLGKTATRTTVFDPVGSACGKDKAELFGTADSFSIG
ncbi:hypothetical protein ACFVT9_35660 [Kitasatospora cineracea]|uniref:hypothetical protein n=1 Tax=Kitasatospora cineracea TaxID=88074 RepID=UPI0036DEF0F1